MLLLFSETVEDNIKVNSAHLKTVGLLTPHDTGIKETLLKQNVLNTVFLLNKTFISLIHPPFPHQVVIY